MTKQTHICVGFALTLPIIATYPISLLGIIGATLPDWDMRVGIRHRTITHSLIALILSTSAISYFNFKIGLVFGLNYLIHLILDSITRMGVPWLYPFCKKYYGFRKIRTGSAEDLFICLIAIYLIVIRVT